MIRTLLLLSVPLASACATVPNPNVVSPLSDKLSTFAYKDEGNLVLLVAGTEAAQYNAGERYFPLFITLANKGAKSLRVTRESFSFEDSLGGRYSPLPVAVIQGEYHRGGFDRRLLAQHLAATGAAVDRYTLIPSSFYPSVTGGIVHDRIEIPRFGTMSDLLYFPVPEEGIRGGPFRLFFRTAEIEEAIVLVFEIGSEPLP